MLKEIIFKGSKRSVALLVMFVASTMMLWAQEKDEKFSMTTQMFLNELKTKKEQSATTLSRAPRRQRPDGTLRPKARRLIATPDTVGSQVYISCFIHLKDVSNLSDVQSLGVEIEETFEGLDFVTARVPVDQLEPLADIDNVTKIKVARQMRPLTDKAREATNVDDLLTHSTDAIAAGIPDKYDGTGVVLGIIDTGIDFQHIAFKDKDGNSRIKRAYVYNGSSAQEYTSITSSSPTTDDKSGDHGTHTATTAGGSSVKVSGSTVTVTDDHANATYGGMAPGADLYLAGVKDLDDTHLSNALKKMVEYADNQGKPLVVSNSWGSGWGPRDGTGTWADLVSTYFGDSHPNHIILFASSNDAGHTNGNEGGGFFVKKSSASSSSPLGTIIRTDEDGGDYYGGLIACAWNASNSTKLNCKIHVLNSSGTIQKSWTIRNETSTFSGLSTYYSGSMTVYIEQENGKYQVAVYSEEGLQSETSGKYTLAIEVYPSSGSADINMWAGDWSFFTDNYTTSGHTWLDGTDDMCVSDEATIPDAISVGAYVTKKSWKASDNKTYTSSVYTVGDIAYFSSYATAEQSPTGVAYPWISAPGARLAAGINHYHTASVDDYSYYGSDYKTDLVVNSNKNPYAMMEGTSMATPVAAGIVALWLQAAQEVNKELTVNDVKDIMEQTAITDSYTNGANGSHFGKGKIDALAGIQYILGSSSSPLIKVTPTSIDFADKNPYATRTYTQTLNVRGMNLEGDITATLSDANGVYTLSQTNITQNAATASGGVDIIITYAPQAAGTHNATITLTSSNADNVVLNVTATAKPATPAIVADPETLTFKAGLSASKSLTFDVLSEFLTGNISVALSDANNVFSIDKTSITKADSEEGATVTVTFLSATAGTFNGTVTLSSAGAENVVISLTGTAKDSSSDPNTTTFKLVSSTSDLEEGMRYIIACGSKATAAGALGNSILGSESVTVNGDVITIGNSVAVFVLEGNQTDGWTFKNESDNQYLYATAVKKLAYGSTENKWTLSDGTAGVIMTYSNESYGTMLYNASSPRFTTYTSSPTAAMIQANLYMEYSEGGTTPVDPTVAYYRKADGKQGEALKTAMSGIIYSRTEKSYDYLWTAFKTTDVRSDGKIWDMYSNITNYTPVTTGSTYSQEGDCYNREHSFPQSWFNSNTPMNTDLHHIYPTDGFVNGKRANYPFGETNGEDYKSANDFSKLGASTYPGYTGKVFEPADEYKGDFARTYFYMITCYEEKLHDWYTNYSSTEVVNVIDGSTYPGFQPWQLEVLMKWAKNDPVSEKETARNNAVYAIQNNRNPFIDYPGLEEYVWGSMTSTPFSYDNYVGPVYKQDVSMSFSPSEATATIGESFTAPTLTTAPADLSVTYSSSNTGVATVNATSGEVTLVAAGTTTITATFAGNDSYNSGSASYTLTVSASTPVVGSGYYALVTDAGTLAAGDKILIAYVNGDNCLVLSTTQNTNNRAATTDVTLNNNGTLTPGSAAQVITLEKDGNNFLFNVADGYLFAASSSKNWLRTEETAEDNAKATISISNGDAAITFQGSYTRNTVRYNPNNNSPIFSCYDASSTTGSAPQIYREIPEIPSITLANAQDNSSIIESNNGKLVNVTLADRTLYKDGAWNTLCLPFNVTIADSPLAGADVRALSSADFTNDVLTLNFTDEGAVTELIAGTPYIIKWDSGEDLTSPVFESVTISREKQDFTSTDGKVQFLGTYRSRTFESEDKSILFMGESNTLYYPESGAAIDAQRAYFQLLNGAHAKAFVLNFGDATTRLTTLTTTGSDGEGPWYDLSGRRMNNGQSLKKGIYIHNGRKVIIR